MVIIVLFSTNQIADLLYASDKLIYGSHKRFFVGLDQYKVDRERVNFFKDVISFLPNRLQF